MSQQWRSCAGRNSRTSCAHTMTPSGMWPTSGSRLRPTCKQEHHCGTSQHAKARPQRQGAHQYRQELPAMGHDQCRQELQERDQERQALRRLRSVAAERRLLWEAELKEQRQRGAMQLQLIQAYKQTTSGAETPADAALQHRAQVGQCFMEVHQHNEQQRAQEQRAQRAHERAARATTPRTMQ